MAVDGVVLDALAEEVSGELVAPGNAEYDEARKVYNFMIDKKPAAVVRCADADDVVKTLRSARDAGADVAVRGGGHSVPGFGTVDDGLVVDLSLMRDVQVDPDARTARVGGGATLGDLDEATHAFGLATPGGIISTTGVAGLTLGGGYGYLSRKYGLSIDNLRSVEVVTADGRIVTASEDENEDLFWGLRGGSGNFGVATSFEFDLHPVDQVLTGPIFYDIDRTEEILRLFDEFIDDAPAEFGGFSLFQIGPPADFVPEQYQGVTMCAIMTLWSGSVEEGEKVLEPLRTADPLIDAVHEAPYPAVQSAFDGLVPRGLQHYWKAAFCDDLSDELLAAHAEHGPKVPTVNSTVHLYPLGKAVAEVGRTDTAFWHRDARYNPVIAGMWPDPADNAANTQWVKDYYAAIAEHSREGGYVNFLADDDQSRLKAVFGDNWERLTQVKRAWDPDNVFHINQNIPPATD